MPVIPPRDAAAIFVAVLIVGTIAIHLWFRREDQRARDQATARARAALMSAPGSTFDEGANAAIDGLEVWQNPYCVPGESNERSLAWTNGWCYGLQLIDEMRGQQ